MDRLDTRWLTPDEIVDLNPVLESRGWMQLSPLTARVLGAFSPNGHLVAAFALQLVPLLGPLLRTDNEARDNGQVTRQLVSEMHEYLDGVGARGYITVCESPVAERLAKRHGMVPVEHPVYERVT